MPPCARLRIGAEAGFRRAARLHQPDPHVERCEFQRQRGAEHVDRCLAGRVDGKQRKGARAARTSASPSIAPCSTESRAQRPARDVILARLLEVLFIEALRSGAATEASAGLLRGLADPCLAAALRRMHEAPARSWTVAELAKEAALSRSSFFERFSRAVGTAPMEYLLAWRMALAKDLLRRSAGAIADVAARVGYSSASTFSVAFTRHVGVPPARYAREGEAVAA